ncbi:hypothetical protein [Pyruvatibacter mobilis]|uniref:hypothetical protein n=1 Tax=Pyruvatibacter mobilis TaxID=1712261 RepID=UPI003BA8C3CE
MEPTENFNKSKRWLILSSSTLIVSMLIGIQYESNGSDWPLKIENGESINEVILLAVVYFLFQYLLFWGIQNSSIKNKIQYKLDYFSTISISWISIFIYLTKWKDEISSKIDLIISAMSFGTIEYVSYGLASGLIAIALFMLTTIFASAKTSKLAETIVKNYLQKESELASRIEDSLINNEWVLVFNPKTKNGRKRIVFLPEGVIGDGINQNENRWRLNGQFLELVNSSGSVFSRFSYDFDKDEFEHTNDDDTLSIRSQRIIRSDKKSGRP